VSTLWLLAIGLGSPAIGLLVGRWLSADDGTRSMREHHEALAVLRDVTQGRSVR
jgi:hypothetical protein